MYKPTTRKRTRRDIKIAQKGFAKGYVSTFAESNMPNDALSDLTNCELVQNALPRPRPSLAPYGGAMVGTCLGIKPFTKTVAGRPEYWEISMQVSGGVGQIYIRKDGAAWTLVGGSYSSTATVQFCQSNNRVYISNRVDHMSYYNIDAGNIITSSALATPSAPAVVKTGLSGTTFTYYVKVSANNAFGETAASSAGTITVGKIRDAWIPASDYLDISWGSVAGATSYNVYLGDSSGSEYYLGTVNGLAFRDDGSISLNTFRLYPAGDSTAGPTLGFLWNSNGQLFGVDDLNNPSYLWYSGTGTNSGDFSPFNGGGYVAINYGGDTVPVAVRAFRTGKGDPAVTVLSKGAAGYGKMHHVTFNSQTVGDTLIIFPNVFEANGQDGTVSPLAVVEENNNLYYPTGTAFKSTGTKPSVINILSTDSLSEQIQPDLDSLNIASMSKAVGLSHQGKIYFALPTGSNTQNSEIWVLDLTRRGLWILRWTVAAKFMWLYQDNTGSTHFCVLVNNVVLEFTRSLNTQDNGVAFKTRAASGGIVFDEAGMTMASVEMERFKLLYPKGTINLNVYGLGEDGPLSLLNNESYAVTVPRTGYGQLIYSNHDTTNGFPISRYSDSVGIAETVSRSVAVRPVEVDEILNQLNWEVITDSAGCDYILGSAFTKGKAIEGLYYGD